MNEKAPGSAGSNSRLATAALVLSMISGFGTPASTHSVRLRITGSSVRTAGALKQFGARSLGFQNCRSSKPAVQERSTKQTNSFLPFTAVSYPWRPRTSTVASPEIDGGAAVRARAISSARLAMRYCSTGAIAGYEVWGVCARAAPIVVHAATVRARPTAFPRFIIGSLRFWQTALDQ